MSHTHTQRFFELYTVSSYVQEVKNETTGEMVNVTVDRPMPMPTAMRESPEYRDAYAVHGRFSAKPTKSRTLNYATNGLDITRKGDS